MTAHRVHQCIRSAMALWAAKVGTATASAEAGCDPSTVRRKTQGQFWIDAEIAAAIAHQIDVQGSSAIIGDLVAIEADRPSLASEAELRRCALGLGAEASRLALAIQERLADGDLSPRDAAEIAEGGRTAMQALRTALKDLDAFVERTKRGVR